MKHLHTYPEYRQAHGAFTYNECRVEDHAEECTCVICGCPMYEGERVLFYAEEPFCSLDCIAEYRG